MTSAKNRIALTRRNFIQKLGLSAGAASVPALCILSASKDDIFCNIERDSLEDYQDIDESKISDYIKSIKQTIYSGYKGMYHNAVGDILPHPFITPGSAYRGELWDWDSWLTNVALKQILLDIGTEEDRMQAIEHERGCILNFLKYGGVDGWLPIVIWNNENPRKDLPDNIHEINMHKPVIAQHAAFLVKSGDDAEWLRDEFWKLQKFIENYVTHSKNLPTGLFYWQDDFAIGVDNDPSTFYRPKRSSGSILLNCFMYKELEAMAYLSKFLGKEDLEKYYKRISMDLKSSIHDNCWDERDGFYYSVDLNLLPITNTPQKYLGLELVLHSGYPRNYHCLIQRLGVWSGFLAMWSGLASKEQADRIVKEHFNNTETFNSAYGIRTLSKMERMYSIYPSSNPSDWQGPIWGISNYMVFRGLVKYGYIREAKEIAYKTIKLFGDDAIKNGAFHEYYDPDTGAPIKNKGFQNWNYLVINMIAWLEKRVTIEEF